MGITTIESLVAVLVIIIAFVLIDVLSKNYGEDDE